MGSESAIGYLSKFPVMRSLLGEWIQKELASGRAEHELICWLQKGEPDREKVARVIKQGINAATVITVDRLTLHHNRLSNLENILSSLRDEPRLNGFLDHLRSPDDFWQGYAEVECAALFKRCFGSVELEPHLPNCKEVEFRFFLKGTPIYVEVAAPKSGQKFEDILAQHIALAGEHPKAFEVPDSRDRVKDAILQQFEHFKGAGILGLVIYNTNGCEFDGRDISDCLLGTSFLGIYTNRMTGESFTRLERKADSVLINDPDLINFGGIICYNREFDLGGKVVYINDLIGIAFLISQMKNIGQAFKP